MQFTRMLCAAAAALLLGYTPVAKADILPIGSSLTFGGTNLPGACTDTTCSDTTTFGTTTLIDGGALQLSETQVADGPNAEWDEWSISTVSGGSLAGDVNGDWNIVMDYDLDAPVFFDQVVTQWTVDGVAVSPLNDFSGITGATSTNPSPITGEAYYVSGFKVPLAAGVQSNWQELFVNPYSFVEDGGINDSTANGLNFALHFTLQTPTSTVPEPGSLALLGTALAVAFLFRRRHAA